jgi:hypothetical protein
MTAGLKISWNIQRFPREFGKKVKRAQAISVAWQPFPNGTWRLLRPTPRSATANCRYRLASRRMRWPRNGRSFARRAKRRPSSGNVCPHMLSRVTAVICCCVLRSCRVHRPRTGLGGPSVERNSNFKLGRCTRGTKELRIVCNTARDAKPSLGAASGPGIKRNLSAQRRPRSEVAPVTSSPMARACCVVGKRDCSSLFRKPDIVSLRRRQLQGGLAADSGGTWRAFGQRSDSREVMISALK